MIAATKLAAMMFDTKVMLIIISRYNYTNVYLEPEIHKAKLVTESMLLLFGLEWVLDFGLYFKGKQGHP